MGSDWKRTSGSLLRGAVTVSLLDLGAGYKRCIHFVKIHVVVHFVIFQQKWIRICIYHLFPWVFGGDKFYLLKQRMPLAPHLD